MRKQKKPNKALQNNIHNRPLFFENIGKIYPDVKKKTDAQTGQINSDNRHNHCPGIPLLDIQSPRPYISR